MGVNDKLRRAAAQHGSNIWNAVRPNQNDHDAGTIPAVMAHTPLLPQLLKIWVIMATYCYLIRFIRQYLAAASR